MSSQARQIRHKPTPAGAFSDLGSVVSQQQRARHQASLERKQQQNARVPSVKPARSESARDTHPHHPYAGAGARWHHTTALPAERPKRATLSNAPLPRNVSKATSKFAVAPPKSAVACMHACMHVSPSACRRAAVAQRPALSLAARAASLTHLLSVADILAERLFFDWLVIAEHLCARRLHRGAHLLRILLSAHYHHAIVL